MKRIASSLVVLSCSALAAAASGSVVDGYVTGYADARSRQFITVGNELGSTFFPGQTLDIRLSETVDINWRERWEESCFLGICGNRRTWIDHNFQEASKWPTFFRIVDETGVQLSGLTNAVSSAGTVTIPIPADGGTGFNRKLFLQAMIADGIPPIDPTHSQGRYTITIRVSTPARAATLNAFLAAAKPTARQLKDAWVNDPFFLEQNRTLIARSLVRHAQQSFPPGDPLNGLQHQELLDYAASIDPSGSEATFAIADMYLAQNNPDGAKQAIIEGIRKLQAAPNSANDRDIQLRLAAGYIKLARVMESSLGYAEMKDLPAIGAHYATAGSIAAKYRAPALQIDALVGRAVVNRTRNTLGSLKTSTDDLTRARDLVPTTYKGMPLRLSPSGGELLAIDGISRTGVGWMRIDGAISNSAAVEIDGDSLIPLAVSRNGRVLASTRSSLGWIELGRTPPQFEPVAPNTLRPVLGIHSTNGQISLVSVTAPPPNIAELMLLNEALDSKAVRIDGKPSYYGEVASQANRYIAVGPDTTGNAMVADLREVTSAGERTIRRVALPQSAITALRIAPDGARFAMLLSSQQDGRASQRLVMWAEQGAEIEIAKFSAPAPGQSLPPESIRAFDFTPDGTNLFSVRADGTLGLLAATPNAPWQSTNALSTTAIPPDRASVRLYWAGESTLVIDADEPSSLRVVNWPNPATTSMPVSRNFRFAVGYWKNSSGVLGAVSFRDLPTTLASIDTQTGKVIGRVDFQTPTAPVVQLLSGGVYACVLSPTEGRLAIKNMVNGEETIVTRSDLGNPESSFPVCLPLRRDHEWLLLLTKQRQAGPTQVQQVRRYKGNQPTTVLSTMPAVPDDIVAVEKAAYDAFPGAKPPFQPPAFLLTDFGLSASDPRPFSTSIASFTLPPPRPANWSAPWISYPVVQLDEFSLSVKRIRLREGDYPLRLLGTPVSRVIYVRRGRVFVKSIEEDAEGTPLFDVRAEFASLGPTHAFQDIRISSDGSTIVFGDGRLSQDTAEVQQHVFSIGAGSLAPIECKRCLNRQVQWKDFSAGSDIGPFQFGSYQTDSTQSYLAVYADDGVQVLDLRTGSSVAALPANQVVWIGSDRAFYISGKNEFSFIRF